MGNTKSYGFEMPLREGEEPPTVEWFYEHALCFNVVIGTVHPEGRWPLIFMGRLLSSSQVADKFITKLREQYPNRWLHIERFDQDMPEFLVIDYNEDGTITCVVADNWTKALWIR